MRGRCLAGLVLIVAGCTQPPLGKDREPWPDSAPEGGDSDSGQPGRPWGLGEVGSAGELDPPEREADGGVPSPWRTVSVGGWAACAIAENDELACWGNGEYDIPDAPDGRYLEVSTSFWYACAIDLDGFPVCWGLPDEHRDLDVGQTDAPTVPLRGISAGAWQACGIDAEDRLVCWGATDLNYAPAPGEYAKVSNGYGVNCGLHTDGTVDCWGWDGQYSRETTPFNDPSSVEGIPIVDIASGYGHSCAVDEVGELHCWGGANWVAVTPPDGFVFASISAGTEGNCGVSPSGEIACWQLDAPKYYFRDCFNNDGPPKGSGWLQVSVRDDYACALSGAREIYCWTCEHYYDPFLVIPPNPTD